MSKPTIICTGMCNTKGAEVRFLAEMVAAQGGRPLIMDLSLGGAVDWADVSLQEVLACTDVKIQDVVAAAGPTPATGWAAPVPPRSWSCTRGVSATGCCPGRDRWGRRRRRG